MLGLSIPIMPIPQAGVYHRKFVIFVHRWLGLAFCLLYALWFVSGIVMMYSDYPSVGSRERLSKAALLARGAIRLPPEAAYSALHKNQPPDQVTLTMLDGRPIYRFRSRRTQSLVYADDGEVVRWLPQAEAERIAAAWTGLPADTAKFQGALMEADQWTLSGQAQSLKPLLKYAWPDGQEVYISGVTGEVVQHTTRASRIAAYFGAIPHWLYFAPLRKNGRLWTKVVDWASGIGTAASLLGLAVGVSMYSPSKRFRYAGEPSSIPYRGQKRWHLILGLIFGLVTCTWVFSGLLSMEPFEWLSDDSEARLC
jgi:hypothetical protein